MKQKKASSTIYIMIFIIILLAFLAFAVDGTIILTNRAKLQNAVEMTALAAAAEFSNPLTPTYEFHNPSCPNITDHVKKSATNTFLLLKQDSLQTANLVNKDGIDNDTNLNDGIDNDVEIKLLPNKVLISAEMISQPFFLSFLGVEGIRLNAKACAQSGELSVSAYYSGNVNWLTVNAAYLSDILSEETSLRDTAILLPLGDFKSASYDTGIVNFTLMQGTNNRALSLGPGGFVTMRLPAPIINKSGPDLSIKELGALEGYLVFVGLDNNPNDPYVQSSKAGGGIRWVNISCSGVTDEQDPTGIVGAYNAPTTGLGPKDKFYGSGKFDLGDDCITGTANDISMAKYLRIIDDNSETAFAKTNGNFYKIMLYGEASTATAGADINEVKVSNYIKLTSPAGF